MKKTILIIPAILAAAFVIGCGDSSKDDKTLAFQNSKDSDGAINEIVWAGDETNKRTKDNGYAPEETTESKVVAASVGSVTCKVMSGTSFIDADVDFSAAGITGNSLSLADGANVFSLKATTGASSAAK